MKVEKQGGAGRLVLVPFPLQGHMNPMLHLAILLHSKGFSVTIVHTQFKSPNRSGHGYPRDINFESISDGLSEGEEADLVSFSLKLNRNCETPFRDCLLRLQSDSPKDPILCIIHDASNHFALAIADDMKLPRFTFRPNCMTFYIGYLLTMQKGCHPIKDQELEEPVKELPFLSIKDLPEIKSSDQHMQIVRLVDGARTATGVIWNTSNQLEEAAFPRIQQDLSVPFFLIGPLHKYSLPPPIIPLAADQSCIAWLDTQAPRSVIYISFGSFVTVNRTELVEMAWGLANSKQIFLWVVRPGSVHSSKWVELLPKEFEELTCGRGRIVQWAPQLEVLAHHAIGGFWTHSGWNSTMESITEGVPMLCSPRFGDQRINARLVSHVWRVGIQLDDGLERGLIEKSIGRIMVDKEGMEMRKRGMDLKGKMELSLSKDGSSCLSLEKLIDFIRSR